MSRSSPDRPSLATPAPAAGGPLEEMSFYLGRAYYNYKVFLSDVLRDLDLAGPIRPGMGHILFALFEEDDCIIREIVRRSGLTAGTVSAMLQQMEKAGLIARRRDPDDGRAVRITLTPMARSLRPRCFQVLERLNHVLEEGISEKDLETTRRVLARMIGSMQAQNRGKSSASSKRRNAS